MPLVAQFIIGGWGWRTAWASLGIYTLFIGVLPALLLMTRRPEDMGLAADPAHPKDQLSSPGNASGVNRATRPASAAPEVNEVNYTVQQALRTRSFWVLAAFSAAGFMVQAGVSLHQVAHFINQGLPGPAAALTASIFAFSQVLGGVLWSALARRMPLRLLLSLSGFTVAVGAIGTGASASLNGGIPSATALGVGVGGLHLLLRLTWADYYGRQHLGSIRGLTLPMQIAGQALGPIIAGFMFDVTGEYQLPFLVFAIAVSLAGLLVLAATPPVQRREEVAP
jgi:sugar phosphate permease